MYKFVPCTLTDISVKNMRIEDIPPDFTKTGFLYAMERYRRMLKLHSEFSDGLNEYDQSALWRSNYLAAAALLVAKVLYKII